MIAGLSVGIPGAHRVSPENMHVTLRFIGEADNVQAEYIDMNLAEIKSPAFEIRLSGVDYFGSNRKVRSLWAGVEKNEILIRLHEKVESAVVRSGQQPGGHKFKPHVTLARFKGGAPSIAGAFIAANNGFAAGPLPIDRFTLFQSCLTDNGAVYSALAEYPLIG